MEGALNFAIGFIVSNFFLISILNKYHAKVGKITINTMCVKLKLDLQFKSKPFSAIIVREPRILI